MTETTFLATSSPEVTVEVPDIPMHMSDFLVSVIVAFLAPMFLGAGGGDIGFARMAALQTVNDYRAQNHADLLLIAQIIGFGFAALGSLSLSMAENISLSMTLRLRGNATALHRAAQQNRRALHARHVGPPSPPIAMPAAARTPSPAAEANHQEDAIIAGAAAARTSIAAAQARLRADEQPVDSSNPAPGSRAARASLDERRQQVTWAAAMAGVADECIAGLPHLPDAERKAACFRAAALIKTVNELLAGRSASLLSPTHG